MELILILAIVLLIFGAGKLPQIGKAMGQTIREFRKSQKEEESTQQPTQKPAGDKPNNA
jgi:sec-independent protein translocase protein TatA